VLDVIEPHAGEEGRLRVAFGNDQPALGDTREEVFEEGCLEVLDLPLATVVQL